MTKIEQRIKEYMDHLSKAGYFNGSVLVAHKGQILLSEGYGKSILEHDVLNTAQTKYRIGSITKGFTAMAILHLHKQGLLDINTPINRIFDNYPNGDLITIHHLLTHTSGIPNFTSFPDYWNHQMRLSTTLEDVINSFENLPLEFVPGTQFNYCNSAYLLLTAIIEKVSGLSYGEYIKRYILEPIQMKNSGCDDGKSIITNIASGYSVWEDYIKPENIDMSFPLGAFGMFSTVEDLYLWDQAINKGELIDQHLLEAMFKPYQHGYGYGWAVWATNFNQLPSEITFTSHFGDINGYCNDMLRCVDEQLTVIVLSNNDITPVMKISRDLAKMVLGLDVDCVTIHDPMEIDREKLQPYVGTYVSSHVGTPIILSEKDGDFFITVAKRYGKEYKLKLSPIEITKNQVLFVTNSINDKVKIRILEKGFEMCYTDTNKERVIAYKGANAVLAEVTGEM